MAFVPKRCKKCGHWKGGRCQAPMPITHVEPDEFCPSKSKSEVAIQKPETKNRRNTFEDGVICSLAIIKVHDEETIFREIVESAGKEKIVKAARKAGAMKWSGLSKYGYGKEG